MKEKSSEEQKVIWFRDVVGVDASAQMPVVGPCTDS
jgi:hypothetical protein